MTDRIQPAPMARPEVAEPKPWKFWTVDEVAQASVAAPAVYAIDCPGQYVASVHAFVAAPLAAEPREAEGLFSVLVRSLDEGTEQHSGEEFARALEREGAAYTADVNTDGMHVQMSVPVSRFQPALALFTEALTAPSFDEPDIRRQVNIRLGEIPQEHANPAILARQSAWAELFDPDTRRSRPGAGTAETVLAITAQQVRDAYARMVRPDVSAVVVAGDLAGIDVSAVQAAFGRWSSAAAAGTEAPSPSAPMPTYRRGGRIVIVDRPGSVQSQLLFAAPGPDRTDPRWPLAAVANHVVGGTINSRVDSVLREEKGYTYGTRSAFSAPRSGGVWTLGGSVRTEVTAPAVEDALRILDQARDGFSDDEVADARDNLTRTAPLRYERAEAVAAQVVNNLACGVPADFVDTYLGGIAAASVAEADEAYRAFIDPAELLTVVVGAADEIEGPLSQLGIEITRI